jgi:phosphohistidine phosphatase
MSGATAPVLHLLRHAKSSWDDPRLSDFDRPLAPRGRKAAKRLARVLAVEDVRPELVLCSPAARTTQTLERVLAALGSPDVVFDESLYHASEAELMRCLREISGVAEALVVGHNPGLAELCLWLARPGPDRDRVAANLPTGAFVTLALDSPGGWPYLGEGCSDIVRLLLPREL